MFVIILGIVVLLMAVKAVNYFANTPGEQIQKELPESEGVPPYDPGDGSLQVRKLRESPNKMWFEVTVRSSDFRKKKKEYNYIAKAKVPKGFIFNPKLEIYSVIIEQ